MAALGGPARQRRRQPQGRRSRAARGTRRGHLPSRPGGRQRDPGQLHLAPVVQAVARGGIIRFRCGTGPSTIRMQATARVFNDRPDVVLDGRGQVTLDGQGARRILYMNTCDPDLVWTTPHCQNQDHPTLTVQNLTFRERPLERHARRWTAAAPSSCGAAGSRSSTASFYGNRCAATGPDVGGAAIQVFSQYEGLPVYVVEQHLRRAGAPSATPARTAARSPASACRGRSSTACSANNRAIGTGANPPKPGTPGGGNGGAIYNDGNTMTLRVDGHADRGQPLQRRGRQRHLLRQQRPLGRRRGRGLGPARQHRRRLLDPPRHLLPGPEDHLHGLRGRVGPGRLAGPCLMSTRRSWVRSPPQPPLPHRAG